MGPSFYNTTCNRFDIVVVERHSIASKIMTSEKFL